MQSYPSDLTDAEWCLLEPLIPPPKPGGRPRTTDMRQICNAIFYVLRTGHPWRYLPHDLPAWSTVYHYFRLWRDAGVIEQMNHTLRELVRFQAGRQSQPTGGSMDSAINRRCREQSAKTTEKGGNEALMGVRRSTVASAIS